MPARLKAHRDTGGTRGGRDIHNLLISHHFLPASGPKRLPYKGSAPAVTDLIGGTIDSVFLTGAAVSSYVEAKQLRALAVTGTQRIFLLPDVPTFQEVGVGGLENDGWFAVFAPAGTPENIVVYLRSKLVEVMAEPGMQAKLRELGLQDAGVMSGKETDSWDKSVVLTQDILRKTRIDMDGR